MVGIVVHLPNPGKGLGFILVLGVHRERTGYKLLIDTLAESFHVRRVDQEFAVRLVLSQSQEHHTQGKRYLQYCDSTASDSRGQHEHDLPPSPIRHPPSLTSISVIVCHLFMATNHLSSLRRQLYGTV